MAIPDSDRYPLSVEEHNFDRSNPQTIQEFYSHNSIDSMDHHETWDSHPSSFMAKQAKMCISESCNSPACLESSGQNYLAMASLLSADVSVRFEERGKVLEDSAASFIDENHAFLNESGEFVGDSATFIGENMAFDNEGSHFGDEGAASFIQHGAHFMDERAPFIDDATFTVPPTPNPSRKSSLVTSNNFSTQQVVPPSPVSLPAVTTVPSNGFGRRWSQPFNYFPSIGGNSQEETIPSIQPALVQNSNCAHNTDYTFSQWQNPLPPLMESSMRFADSENVSYDCPSFIGKNYSFEDSSLGYYGNFHQESIPRLQQRRMSSPEWLPSSSQYPRNEDLMDLAQLKMSCKISVPSSASASQDYEFVLESSPSFDNNLPKRRHSSAGCQNAYKCPFEPCGKIFSRFYNLRSHYRIHSGEKPFACQSCDASFARNHDLKRHQRIHSGMKPFRCDICHKSFSRNDAMTRHVKLNSCHKNVGDLSSSSPLTTIDEELLI